VEDLALNRRTEYGVRLCLVLARGWPTRRVKARELAQAAHVSPGFAAQVLGALVRAGLVHSFAGPRGGYELARDPAEVSLLEAIQALTGELVSGRCMLWGGRCVPNNPCAIHDAWHAAQHAFVTCLAHTDLASLAHTRRQAVVPHLGGS
jgi:Rrf2 family protein